MKIVCLRIHNFTYCNISKYIQISSSVFAIILQELLLSREVYEIGAQYSVATKDVASFERYMSMLKSIYTDQSAALPESSRMYELLGLNLLFLLSQNRLGDFHTELELLPPDILLSNPYIESPVQLEQFIMEGKYNKVIDTRYNVPADSYKFFIDVLLVTIRDEIGKFFNNFIQWLSCTKFWYIWVR